MTIIIVVIGLICLIVYGELVEKFKDRAQPEAIKCPKLNCEKIIALSDITCDNCGHKGTIYRKVLRHSSRYAENIYECDNCKSRRSAILCPSCRAGITQLFNRK